MSGIATAVIGGAVIGAGASIYAGKKQGEAAKEAAAIQGESAQLGIEESRRQFDAIKELLAPYRDAGVPALKEQQALLGLLGSEEQAKSIQSIQGSPEMAAMLTEGENAILQNASATGGLRGGNTQAALAKFRPQLLSQLIQKRFQDLGQLTSIGQNAAAGTGNAGMNTSNQVVGLLQQTGAAQAGGVLGAAQGQAYGVTNAANQIGGAASTLGMLKALKVF